MDAVDARSEAITLEKKLNGHSGNGKGEALGPPHHEEPHEEHEPDDQDDAGDNDSSPIDTSPMEVREVPPAPPVIEELSASCIRYVERKLGVRLDYSAETLPLLDHYLADAEKALVVQNENDPNAARTTLILLMHTAGAYFGEVVRRRYPAWWRCEGSDPMAFRVELETAYLAFSPMLFIYEALSRELTLHGDQAVFEAAQIEMDEEDQKAAAERLAELTVSDEEYFAPSTRLEAIDVCVDTIRTRRLADGDVVEMALTPEDYET